MYDNLSTLEEIIKHTDSYLEQKCQQFSFVNVITQPEGLFWLKNQFSVMHRSKW